MLSLKKKVQNLIQKKPKKIYNQLEMQMKQLFINI